MRGQPVALSLILAFAALLLARAADVQQPGRVYRLGWLAPNIVSGGPGEAFLGAMRDLGYIEGENLVIEVRDAMGRPDRFAPLAAELVALKPDCIVVMGVEPTQAAGSKWPACAFFRINLQFDRLMNKSTTRFVAVSFWKLIMIQAQGRRSFYDSRMGKARQFRVSQRTVELFAAKPMKHSGEFLMACVLLLITLPLMLIVALAIKLESPGPVFERRQRSGLNSRPFQLLSFRTMGPRPEPGRSTWQPTLVGQFLKSTRIDALPQLFNVVRGELSLMETTLFD